MKIQYISDLHLEFYEKIENIPIIPSANILCLAGDIGNPLSENYDIFLKWCANNYEKTFIIPGNHEYYNIDLPMEEINAIIEKKATRYFNITYLNRRVEFYKGYTFIGCLLWSYIPDTIPDENLKNYNDFFKIRLMNRIHYNNLFFEDLKFLEKNIKTYKTIICLTHHLPSYDLVHPIYQKSENFMFASDLNYLFVDNIKLWIFGHTHLPIYKKIKNTTFVCNPFGYPNITKYKEMFEKIIELDDLPK